MVRLAVFAFAWIAVKAARLLQDKQESSAVFEEATAGVVTDLHLAYNLNIEEKAFDSAAIDRRLVDDEHLAEETIAGVVTDRLMSEAESGEDEEGGDKLATSKEAEASGTSRRRRGRRGRGGMIPGGCDGGWQTGDLASSREQRIGIRSRTICIAACTTLGAQGCTHSRGNSACYCEWGSSGNRNNDGRWDSCQFSVDVVRIGTRGRVGGGDIAEVGNQFGIGNSYGSSPSQPHHPPPSPPPVQCEPEADHGYRCGLISGVHVSCSSSRCCSSNGWCGGDNCPGQEEFSNGNCPSQCPADFPWAYRPGNNFDYCCSSGDDNHGRFNINNNMNRMQRSDGCKDNHYRACPAPPCVDHR